MPMTSQALAISRAAARYDRSMPFREPIDRLMEG
ncbi:hypothetical protein IL54_0387 [Sphingobium sp. ba1]|nr:hypothetical protein IL54_0387 [Sphingobium sp. ba1]